jgi:di/tricarboxylate transporter
MFIPVVLTIAKKTGLNPRRMLMPLSIAALTSGMMTLIASSPNLIIESTLRARGVAPFGFFSWTPFGLAVLATSMAVLLAARPVLSKQVTAPEQGTTSPSAYDLVGRYGLADRWQRLRILADSPLVDQSVAQMQNVYDRFEVVLVGLEKHAHGRTQFLPALADTLCETGDAILIVAGKDRMQEFVETQRLVRLSPLDERERGEALQELGVAEVMLAPESKLIGKILGELEFRARYGISVLAIRRRGQPLTANFDHQPLDFGDTLLVSGDWAHIPVGGSSRELRHADVAGGI